MAKNDKFRSIVDALRQVRQRIDVAIRDKADPTQALVAVGVLLTSCDGEIGGIRDLAPGLGELWDTLRAMERLCDALADRIAELTGDVEDAGVQSAAGEATPLDRELFPGRTVSAGDWSEAEADD